MSKSTASTAAEKAALLGRQSRGRPSAGVADLAAALTTSSEDDDKKRKEEEREKIREQRKAKKKAEEEAKKEGEEDEDDACWCIYCAIKRLFSSGYFCVGCFVCIIVVTLVSGVFSIKGPTKCTPPKDKDRYYQLSKDSDVFNRRIAALNGRGFGRTPWDEDTDKSGILGGLYGMPDLGYGRASLRETNNPVDSGAGVNGELAGVQFDINAINGDESNERLRNFYKKLMKTDAQIRRLKMGLVDPVSSINSGADSHQNRHRRMKRSLQQTPEAISNVDSEPNNDWFYPNREERSDNDTEPTSLVFEKKKLYLQLSPKKDTPMPVDQFQETPILTLTQMSDEDKEKLQYSQRFDKILDQVLDDKMEPFDEPQFETGNLFASDTEATVAQRARTTTSFPKRKGALKKVHSKYKKQNGKLRNELDAVVDTTTPKLTDFENYFENDDSITSRYDVILSISPIPKRKQTKTPAIEKNKAIAGRRLQTYANDVEEVREDNLEYREDGKEHDNTYQSTSRTKRNGGYRISNPFIYVNHKANQQIERQ